MIHFQCRQTLVRPDGANHGNPIKTGLFTDSCSEPKKQALAGLPDVFGNGREQMREQADAEKDELYKQIGQMKVELDFLKKRAGLLS